MSSLECFGDWFTNTYTRAHTRACTRVGRERGTEKENNRRRVGLTCYEFGEDLSLFLHFFKADTQNNGGHYGLFIHICHFIFVTIFLSTKTEVFFFLFPKICLAVYIANFVLSLTFKARHSGKLRYCLSPRRCNLAVTYLLLFFLLFL